MFLLFSVALNLDIRVRHPWQSPVKLIEALESVCNVPVISRLAVVFIDLLRTDLIFFSIYILFPLSFYSKRYNLLRDFGLITMYHLPLFTDITLSPISPRYFPAECCSQPLWVPSGSSPPFSATQGFDVLSSDSNLRFSSDGLWTGNDLSCLVH